MADDTLHSYELLDSAATDESGVRYERGDELLLTARRGDELEALGAVRPSGTDDSSIIDQLEPGADERDVPRIMESAANREALARIRMGKRKPANRKAPSSDQSAESRVAGAPSGRPGQPEASEQPPTPGREKVPGRRS